MKKVVMAALLGLLVLSAPSAAVAQERDLHRRLLRSTGLVIASGKERGIISIGACWVVDRERRLVVTNYHVVHGHPSIGVVFPAYRHGRLIGDLAYYKKQSALPGRVLVMNHRVDLAIVQLRWLPPEVIALPLAQGPPRIGQRVYALGNSQRQEGVIWWFRQGRVRHVRLATSRRKGQVLRAHMILSTPNSEPGDSGGPVVDASGRLVGVHSGTGKFSESIQVREVKSLLRRMRY